jgi:hypothetical protein
MNWKDEIKKEDEPSDSAEYMIEDIKEYCDDISIEAEDVKNRKALARALNDLMSVLATLKEADIE